MKKRWILLAASAIVIAGIAPVAADDSAASKSAGGIVLVHEARISMESEKLTIGPTSRPHDPNTYYRVTVDYEFVNHSGQDITTVVGFPVPPYDISENVSAAGMRDFDDFRLWVNGQPRNYQINAHAFFKGKDVTEIVESYGLDVASLGHVDAVHSDDPWASSPQIAALPAAARKRLRDLGLVMPDNVPLWAVHKTYYWTQTFPAHATVRIRHEYTAAEGFEEIEGRLFTSAGRTEALAQSKRGKASDPTDEIRNIEDSCVDSSLQRRLAEIAKTQEGYVGAAWVDFILTTANYWQTPIKSFELDLERLPGPDSWVSVCWDGPVRQVDATHLRMTAKDFVPKHELHVLFLY